MAGTRTETDSLGSIDIDADRYWGPQTERARRLFRIGEERFPAGLIRAVGLQKQAAAEANRELGELPADLADPIITAAREIADGRMDAEFPLPVWQTGSGTQTNMNANEVISNRANELLGQPRGTPQAGASERSRQPRPVLQRQLPHDDAHRRGRGGAAADPRPDPAARVPDRARRGTGTASSRSAAPT